MPDFSIADAIAIVTLFSGLAATWWGVKRASRASSPSPLPEVHPDDTLVKVGRELARNVGELAEQSKEIAEEMKEARRIRDLEWRFQRGRGTDPHDER